MLRDPVPAPKPTSLKDVVAAKKPKSHWHDPQPTKQADPLRDMVETVKQRQSQEREHGVRRPSVDPERFEEYKRRMDIKYGHEDTTRGRRPMSESAMIRGYHETDAVNDPRIREKGLLPINRTGNPDEPPAVWLRDRPYEGETPEGRVRYMVEIPREQARGIRPGNETFQSYQPILPEQIREHPVVGGATLNEIPYRPGSMGDYASGALGLAALLGQAATMVPGFSRRFDRTAWLANGGPLNDLFQNTLARMPSNPYAAPGWYGNATVSA